MTLRAVLLLLALIVAPAAAAQPAPVTFMRDLAICESTGSNDGLADLDVASCEETDSLRHVNPQGRALWLRGRIDVAAADIKSAPLGFYTGALAAREVWWNGQPVGGAGRVGASRAAEIPGDLDAVSWIPAELIRPGENEVAIRFSSFHLPILVHTPVHYAYAAGASGFSRAWLRAYGMSLAATGALVAAAIFFGFAFVMNRRVLGSLFISMMSLFAVGQLWLEAMRGFVSYPYPVQIWRLSGIAVLAFAFALSMTAYVAGRFTPNRWRLHVACAAILALLLAPVMPGFDGKTLSFIMGPAIVSLVSAAQGAAARRPGALFTTLALVVFLALILLEQQSFLDRTFYLAVSVLALALFVDQVRALRRAREAEEQAKRRAAMLELELLRRRIAPHFLMNTLNALAEWVESDPKTGVKMIEALAGEFRLLSQISDRALIPLSEEIALCRRHLEVMSYRVDRPFSLAVQNIDETAEVPPGVLHTLVENAFTHGRFADGGEFVLTRETGEDGDQLVLVTPRAAPSGERKEPRGEGLSYVRRRLEEAFGERARVESAASPDGWRTVLTIPHRLAAT